MPTALLFQRPTARPCWTGTGLLGLGCQWQSGNADNGVRHISLNPRAMLNRKAMSGDTQQTEHFVVEPDIAGVKIADLEPWYFWMRCRSLDIERDEIRTATPERQLEIKSTIQKAMSELRDAPIPGLKFWMRQHRAMN